MSILATIIETEVPGFDAEAQTHDVSSWGSPWPPVTFSCYLSEADILVFSGFALVSDDVLKGKSLANLEFKLLFMRLRWVVNVNSQSLGKGDELINSWEFKQRHEQIISFDVISGCNYKGKVLSYRGLQYCLRANINQLKTKLRKKMLLYEYQDTLELRQLAPHLTTRPLETSTC